MERECFVYTIEIESCTNINGNCFYNEKTLQQWEITIFNDDDYFNIVINVVEYPQTNASEILPIYKLFQSLNPILQHLHLRLTHDGKFHSVVNKKEIEKRWNDKKETLFIEYGDVKQGKSMIQMLDNTYYWINETIQQSLLHFVFLSQYGKTGCFSAKLASVLNEGSSIKIGLTRLRPDDNTITIQGDGTVDNLSHLRKMYNEQIKPFTQSGFQYEFSINSNYTLGKNGSIQNIVAFIKEQSSDKFIHQKTVRFNINPKEETRGGEKIPD